VHRKAICWIAGLVCCGLPAPGRAASQEVLQAPADTRSSAEASENLRTLIGEIFAAVKAHDDQKMASYFAELAIPNHAAWFAKTFGAEEGGRLEAQYSKQLPQAAEDLRHHFEYALKSNRSDLDVNVVEKATSGVAGLQGAVVASMQQPTPLYVVTGRNKNEKYDVAIGEFVFVQGGFRYLDTRVLQQLSKAPVMRIRMGGNVRAASLKNRVQPVYPEEAKTKHIKGTVRLHTVTDVDGAIKEISVVSGDAILAKAAVEAVRQWRYQPVLLNGNPVEVDSTVDVVFD
jgi:TonB family protein